MNDQFGYFIGCVIAIGGMMWIIDGYDTCNSWHGTNNISETEALQQRIWGVSLLIPCMLLVCTFL